MTGRGPSSSAAPELARPRHQCTQVGQGRAPVHSSRPDQRGTDTASCTLPALLCSLPASVTLLRWASARQRLAGASAPTRSPRYTSACLQRLGTSTLVLPTRLSCTLLGACIIIRSSDNNNAAAMATSRSFQCLLAVALLAVAACGTVAQRGPPPTGTAPKPVLPSSKASSRPPIPRRPPSPRRPPPRPRSPAPAKLRPPPPSAESKNPVLTKFLTPSGTPLKKLSGAHLHVCSTACGLR
jgi:hypothetical protein